MRLFILVLLFCCSAVVFASRKSYNGYKVYVLQTNTTKEQDGISELHDINIDFLHSPKKMNKPFNVMVHPNQTETFERSLNTHNIFYKLIVDDAET